MKSGRIQVELPIELETAEHKTSEKQPNYFLMVLLFLATVLLFAAGLVLFFMGPVSKAAYHCEIGRFSGKAEVFSYKKNEWMIVTRRTHREITLYPRDKVRTGPEADVDLKIENALDLRLKASSEIEILRPKRGAGPKDLRLKLHKGSVLGLSNEVFKDRLLVVEVPFFIATIPQASFLIQADREDKSSIGILDGAAQVESRRSKATVNVKALETLTVGHDQKEAFKPKRVGYQEWKALGEARDLTVESVEEVAEQLDLRQKAGSFFKYVFDEGIFYTPHWGYANREFYEVSSKIELAPPEGLPSVFSKEDPGTVILKLDYDVFPQDSFSGIYFKIRDLDLSKVKRLSFRLKGDPEKPLPDQFRIELKDNLSTVRGFAVKPITRDWRLYDFHFNATKPAPISEVVLVFENSKVGPLNTNGIVYIKELTIE